MMYRGGRIVALLTLYSLPALAVAPESVLDVRCLVVTTTLLNSPDDSDRAAGISSAFYFLGRLDGREPHADLKPLIIAESKRMTSSDLRIESERCRKVLSARGAEIAAIGREVTSSR
jgi:hypothetical protein